MKKIEQKVLKFIDEKRLINENDKVLVALSGGPDSVFLLHFLKKYSKKLKITLGAVHINHLLRGKDAEKDEKFCNKISEKYGIRFYSVKKNIKSAANKEKISVEEAGRQIRYKVFNEISIKDGYTKIATAHNADENAETVLLNLIKGAGPSGLSGIPPSRDKIIRPLLILTKQEILGYLDYHRIKYRTDVTNFENDAERNFLRNKVIPLIKKRLNPSLSNTLLKSSEVFRNTDNLVKRKIIETIDRFTAEKEDYITLSLNEFNKVDYDFRSEVIRYIFFKKYALQLSFDDCKKILSLIGKQKGKSVQLFGKIKIFREREELIIHKERGQKKFKAVPLYAGESVKIDDKELSVKEVEKINNEFSYDRNHEFISGDNISKEFLIRRWQSGDRFFPLGMNGSKKVSDFLNEQKILSFKKKEQLVLLNQDKIVWVLGLRLDERFRVTTETKKVYQLCLS